MLKGYLEKLREHVTEEEYREILKMAQDDINFNRTSFNKNTNDEEFIRVIEISRSVLKRC